MWWKAKPVALATVLILVLTLILAPFATSITPARATVGWTKSSANVTLDNQKYLADAWVIKDGTTYKMWYTRGATTLTLSEIVTAVKGIHYDDLIDDALNMDLEGFLNNLSDLIADIPTMTTLLNGTSTVIGYATSHDGKTWTVKDSEVLAGTGANWTAVNSVGTPCVIKDGDTYRMWFTGASTNLTEASIETILTDLGISANRSGALDDLLNSSSTYIGYATSTDGKNWSAPQNVFSRTGSTWSSIDSVGAPCVIKDGSTYKMWYTAGKTTFTQADLDAILADIGSAGINELLDIINKSATIIGYATSSNGVNWTIQDSEVLPGNTSLTESVADPYVMKSGNTYRMWYTNIKPNLVAANLSTLRTELNELGISDLIDTFRTENFSTLLSELLALDLSDIVDLLAGNYVMIGYATSTDGVNWTVQKDNDLVGSSVNAWSSVAAPTVVKSNTAYEMWFTEGVDDEEGEDVPLISLMRVFAGDDLPLGYAYKSLETIAVTPATATIDAGETQQFEATGTYADITDNVSDIVTWSSTNTAVASVDANGLITSYNEGTTTIKATIGAVSGNATLTVDPAVLVSIDVTPANPTIRLSGSQQFRAMGTYSNGATDEITTSTGVNWASANTSVADIGLHTGLATTAGKAAGTSLITATHAATGVSGNTTLTVTAAALQSIAVTPADPSVAAGKTKQFTATGTFEGPTQANLTDLVTWTSSNTTFATIVAGGLATSYTSGNTTIIATLDSVSGNTTLEVTAPVVSSVVVTPVNPTITFVAGDPPTLQFTATTIKTDSSTANITGTATWDSGNTTVADDPVAGLLTTKADGATVVTATDNATAISGNTTLTVLPDTVAPVVILTGPTEGLILGSANVTVIGNVDDTTAYTRSHTQIILNGTAIDVNPDPDATTGDFSQVVALNSGSNTILVRATDDDDNTGTSGTRIVEYNAAKPTITITSPAAGIITNNATRTVTGTISPATITTATLIFNGDSSTISVSSGNFTQAVTLLEGTNVIVVNAYRDSQLGTSGIRTITLDTAAPVVTIDSPASGSVVNTAGVEVSGTINDPGVTSVNLTLNGGAPQAVQVVEGNFNQNVTLTAGANTIAVSATDIAGNSSSSQVTVTLDTTKPAVTVTAPANNLLTNVAGQLVTGTVSDPAATVKLIVNGTEYDVSVAPNGSFSKMTQLITGANTISVTATDAATNVGTSGTINVTVDTTRPSITVSLTDPTDSVTITVASNEALQAAPTVTVYPVINPAGAVTMVDINRWSRTDGNADNPIPAGDYTVTVTGTDKAGNSKTRTATFVKETITVTAGETATVETATTTVQIETTADVTDGSVSVTQHSDNPSGIVGNPDDATLGAGAFIEIVVSPEIRDNLEQVYIRVDYDQADIDAQNIDESTLRLYLWNITTGQWELVPGSGVNTTDNYIYGTVTSLSKYSGFGSAVEVEERRRPVTGPAARPAGTTDVSAKVTTEGRFKEDVTAKSDDELCWVTIAEGTTGLTRHGNPLTEITIVGMDDPPAMPAYHNIIGLAYKFGPEGATFDPPITVTFTYDPSLIPDDVDEENLVIAVWNDSTDEWDKLDSVVDTADNTITAEISHFSTMAVLATTRPAAFVTSDLSISPAEVDIGETVTISLQLSNTGDLEGTYEVTLEINNVVVETAEVTLAGGDSETVTFTTSQDTAGTYDVTVDGLSGTFKVKEAVAPPPPPPAPAAFTTSNLAITPAEVNIGETVTISLQVSNTGELEGTYGVTLKINGVVVATKDITLDGGASQKVTFTTSQNTAGTYNVSVDGLSGTFKVKEAIVEEEEVPPPPPPPAPAFNWWLVIGPVIGIVVIGLIIWFVVIRRRE